MFNRGRRTGAVIDVEYQEVRSQDFGGSPSAGPITFSGVSLGSPSQDRKVVVLAGCFRAAVTGRVVAGVTVGGIAAVKVIDTGSLTFASGSLNLGIWVAEVPSGTTGDVVLSFNNDISTGFASIYSLTTASTGNVGEDFTSDDSFGLQTLTTTVDAGEANVTIAGSFAVNGVNPSFTGVNKDAGVDVRSNEWFACGSIKEIPGSSPKTTTVSDAQLTVAASWSISG